MKRAWADGCVALWVSTCWVELRESACSVVGSFFCAVALGRREGLWARFFSVAKTRNISGESVSMSVSGPVKRSGLNIPTT